MSLKISRKGRLLLAQYGDLHNISLTGSVDRDLKSIAELYRHDPTIEIGPVEQRKGKERGYNQVTLFSADSFSDIDLARWPNLQTLIYGRGFDETALEKYTNGLIKGSGFVSDEPAENHAHKLEETMNDLDVPFYDKCREYTTTQAKNYFAAAFYYLFLRSHLPQEVSLDRATTRFDVSEDMLRFLLSIANRIAKGRVN